MFHPLDRSRLDRTRRLMRSEQLRRLKFKEAFQEQLAMTALLIDMTSSFASPGEYRRITGHCACSPSVSEPNDAKNANQRS